MKELDLLKKDWQKSEASFEQLSEKDIYKMIHTKSSSIVKWILIVSILEFVVLNGIGLLLPDNHHTHTTSAKLDYFLNYSLYLNYAITFYFVYLFYKNYKSICIIDSTKKLAESILKTRKTVKFYIGYNIFYVILIFILISIDILFTNHIVKNDSVLNTTEVFVILFIATLLIIGFVWGFYQLLYGFLLKKLKKNYQELQKIES
jgi:hypothetical protein